MSPFLWRVKSLAESYFDSITGRGAVSAMLDAANEAFEDREFSPGINLAARPSLVVNRSANSEYNMGGC
jgi:hypothetical protein